MFSKRNIICLFLFLLLIFAFLSMDKRKLFVVHGEEATSSIDIALEEKINEILLDERLQGSITGISVRKASGEEIYANQSDIRLHPASNMKILTAITALDVLGADYSFTTSMYSDGKIVGNQLQGNVYIQGQGDPTLQKEDLDRFATALKEKGIKEIKGHIIGDDTWFDNIRLSQDLNWSDEPFHTGAQISALTLSPNKDYDAGTILIEVSPSKNVGKPARVTVTPNTDYVTIRNKTRTIANGKGENITIDREHGVNDVIVKGNIAIDAGVSKSWAAVWEPTKYVLDVFTNSLKNQGITVPENAVKTGKVPEHAKLITKKESMPLKELILPFMKLSNNGHAEVLVKEMGKHVYQEGSWDTGIKVMEQTLRQMGVDANAIQIRDGSGMSHKNFVTASEITKLLYLVQEKEWYAHFFNSLPISGEPDRMVGGTLRYRLKEEPTRGNVYAKTGSITGVSTLAGYVTTVNGENLIFSVLLNNYVDESVSVLVDEIVRVIATHQ